MAVPHTPADVYRGRQRCGPWTVMHARRVRSSLSGVEGLGVVIEFGWVCYQDTYPDVSCMYPEGYTYPDVS